MTITPNNTAMVVTAPASAAEGAAVTIAITKADQRCRHYVLMHNVDADTFTLTSLGYPDSKGTVEVLSTTMPGSALEFLVGQDVSEEPLTDTPNLYIKRDIRFIQGMTAIALA